MLRSSKGGERRVRRPVCQARKRVGGIVSEVLMRFRHRRHGLVVGAAPSSTTKRW